MPETNTSLLRRLIQGDNDAWSSFVRWYLPLIYHWCRQWNLRPEPSADISQEVLMKVSQAIPKFATADSFSSFRGWLRTVTRNVIIDWLRKHGDDIVARGGTTAQQVLESVRSEDEETGAATVDEEQFSTIDDVRCEFSEKVWEAFWLTTVEDFSGDEVAAKLGMGRGAVYQAKYRVLKRLRAALPALPRG